MTLFKIDRELWETMQKAVDPETGEFNENFFELIDSLEKAREDKVEGIALRLKNARAEAEAIKAEKLVLASRQATAEANVKRLEDYLAYALQGEKFATARVAVSYRKSEQVVIGEDAVIPEAYTNIKVTPNKTAIKARLKAGETIPGCEVVSVNNLQVK